MDGWENYLAVQRMIEMTQRFEQEQRQIAAMTDAARQFDRHVAVAREQERAFHESMSVQRMLAQVAQLSARSLADTMAQQALAWQSHERLLRASITPFPDLNLLSATQLTRDLVASYDRLNVALAASAFLANVGLEQDAGPDDDQGADVESQLIEVVPKEALEALRRVRFAPFSLLSTALARPATLLELDSRTFEEFIAQLVAQLGIEDVILTPAKADGGRDVIGTVRVLGISFICAFECKRYDPDRPVSVEYARALLGTITHSDSRADRGVLVTTSRFTKPANQFIVTSPHLEGRDFNGIVGWLRQYGERRRADMG